MIAHRIYYFFHILTAQSIYILFIFSAQNDEPADEKAPSMGAKTLCIPFNQPADGVNKDTKCFACGEKALSYTLWGRSY